MDTQANNKLERGEYGFVTYAKKENLLKAIKILLSCFIIFFIGTTFFKSIETMFIVVSMVMILPGAQCLSKYISYRIYNPMSKEDFDMISSISDKYLTLGGMAIVRGKKTHFYQTIVITQIGVFALIEDMSNEKEYKNAILSILKSRGIDIEVTIFGNVQVMNRHLVTNNSSLVLNYDQKVQQDIATELIKKAH